ncbi:MAG: hypothetical protein M1821_009412 [Bathelium mastoideum]|nr:MAG: hypothetical protein M1821_009412 [Bathelium mastoideum]
MSFQSELASWFSTTGPQTSKVPEIGSKAPSSQKLELPPPEGTPTIISFLRHCGCPFAEKAFLELRTTASLHPDLPFVAISHSSATATAHWQSSLPLMPNESPDPPNLRVIVDEDRELFARWGLGIASFWHVLSPGGLYSLYRLGTEEGIRNRPTESGSRWQTSGNFAVDGNGIVRWGGPVQRADQVPDFEDVVRLLEGKEKAAKL